MKQTIYIDRDEEITSVIDKLRHSKAAENSFVIPERSVILQSIVSLKLFKKEAEKLGKKISIATSDEQGRLRIEKAEIALEALTENRAIQAQPPAPIGPAMLSPANKSAVQDNFKPSSIVSENKAPDRPINNNPYERLNNLGTSNFFSGDRNNDLSEMKISSEGNRIKEENKIQTLPNKEMLMPRADIQKKERMYAEISREKTAPRINDFKSVQNFQRGNQDFQKNFDPRKEEIVNNFFNHQPPVESSFPKKEEKKQEEPTVSVSGGMKKFFVIFAIICFAAIVGVFSFIMLPKAKIIVNVKNNEIEKDFEVKADKNISQADYAFSTIPARIIEVEETLDYSASATGNKSSSNKKAKGKVVIYNEYGSEPQSLVATTRLETSEGKIFRIIKGVTVPGMNSGKPGEVEVEVVADQSGEEYNIEPSDFKIPGFSESPKYEKFYAKSAQAMTGGGEDANSGVKFVTEQDLEQARKKAEEQIKANLLEKAKKEMIGGEILLDEASEIKIVEAKAGAKINQTVQNFNYSIKAGLKSIVFVENDVKNVFAKMEDGEEVVLADVNISYGQPTLNFESSNIQIKAHGKIESKGQINADELKNNLLGKNEEEIRAILGDYPNIVGIDLELWPEFLAKKIPKNASRVELQIN